jgi:PadR family transcriptional regulator, regulatory protein PadR
MRLDACLGDKPGRTWVTVRVDIYRKPIHDRIMAKPLRDPSFLILAALADRELHGYGIISEVKQLSGGRVKLGPGTLYGTLDKLSEQGLIEPTRTEVVDGRLRRYYGITGKGLSAVKDEAAQREETLRAAANRLRLRQVPGATA